MNYYDTFILAADDCPVTKGIIPVVKEGKAKSIHAIQYEFMSEAPYKYTQDDILFMVYAERNNISSKDGKIRAEFFDKSHPCLRCSALAKKYGWGMHFNSEGKVALFSKDSSDYKIFENGEGARLKLVKAMRNKRA